MNYNEIVNRFKEIVEDHNMLVDFGYGQISDIKTRSEGDGESEGADYPYLFLNPGVHNREESVVTYNFNMIIMDMAREEEASEYQNFLNIQSNCIQYCDDVIARLYYHYKDKPEISFTVSYTPFYERFQDQLAGATATISIQVPSNINECIAPFDAYFAKSINDVSLFVDPDDAAQIFASKWRVPILEEEDIANIGTSFITFYQAGTYLLEIEGPYTFIEPVGAEVMPSVPVITVAGIPSNISPIASNWPVVWPGAQALNWKSSYEVVIPDVNFGTISFVSNVDQPGDESGYRQEINGNITITKTA